MPKNVGAHLAGQFHIQAVPGTKTECPYCHHRTFSIKRDDTIAKCFHPDCGRYVTAWSAEGNTSGLHRILDELYQVSHRALLDQQDQPDKCAYRYLVDERRVHPKVVADAMLGVVPQDCDVEKLFEEGIETADEGEREALTESRNKLLSCINEKAGWLCFFYTDQYHRITSIRSRQPYTKNIRYFKPLKSAGVFGLSLFSTKSALHDDLQTNQLIVTEGEFNVLQLQSLAVRRGEQGTNDPCYVNACAVGGVQNADCQLVARLTETPTVCYDNDTSEAGLKLVERMQNHTSVRAFTTPPADSDLDDYIRSFGSNHSNAWEAVRELLASVTRYPRLYEPVAEEVERMRKAKDREFIINRRVADTIRGDLATRGTFYRDVRGTYFFDETAKDLIPLDPDHKKYIQLLDNFGINRTERIYPYILENLRVKAAKDGIRADIRRLTYYDASQQVMHFSNNANGVYQIRKDDINLVDNGTDGVLFETRPDAEPFKLLDKAPTGSPLHDTILSQVNFATDVLLPDERRLLLFFWIMSVIFGSAMKTRLILAFLGEKGSGKSSTLRRLGIMLYGQHFDVTPLPQKVDDFDVAVTNSEYVALDNADTRCSWLPDRLAVVSTGGMLRRRVLYTTNELISYPISCALAITARTPKFGRDDVADRSLIMRVERLSDTEFIPERMLIDEVLTCRDALWTEMADHTQVVLRALEEVPADAVGGVGRMADFSSFALRVATFLGIAQQVRVILEKLGSEQSDFTLEGDVLLPLLCEWVKSNAGREVAVGDLYSGLKNLAETKDAHFPYANAQTLSRRLGNVQSNLNDYLRMETRKGHAGTRHYTFWPVDGEQSETPDNCSPNCSPTQDHALQSDTADGEQGEQLSHNFLRENRSEQEEIRL